MSNNASRFAPTRATKDVGYHVAFTATEREAWSARSTPVLVDPLAPTLALSAPDLQGRKPVAWANGSFCYDEANVVCRISLGAKRTRYERWVLTRHACDLSGAAGMVC